MHESLSSCVNWADAFVKEGKHSPSFCSVILEVTMIPEFSARHYLALKLLSGLGWLRFWISMLPAPMQ